MNDASGRYGGGLFGGRHRRLVDRNSCDQLNRETEEFYKNIPGNLVNITRIVPYSVQTVVAQYEVHLVDKKVKVRIFWLLLGF